MHSYEDRIRAVELYYRYGKKASVVVMELAYPSTKIRCNKSGEVPTASWDHNIQVQENILNPKVTSEYCSYIPGAYNKDYVKCR